MCEIKFIKKESIDGHGNFKYTYQCFCSPKPLKVITVNATNDSNANFLAQEECDKYCGKKDSSSMKV